MIFRGYEVIITRTKRKTLLVRIEGGKLHVRANKKTKEKEITSFLENNSSWITKTAEYDKRIRSDAETAGYLTKEDLKELFKTAEEYIPQRTEALAALMGVQYNKLSIKLLKSRWGSCSSGRNISLNVLLMLADKKIIDSVIIHELCHTIEMNHSGKFYEKVYKFFPEYRECISYLRKDGGRTIMERAKYLFKEE